MAKWEEEVIYDQRRTNLIFWGPYIYDVLLLWEGDRASLDLFIGELISNDQGIVLQHEAITSAIHFLDL